MTFSCEYPSRPYVIAKNPTTRKALIYQPRCKLWTCPYCAQRNMALWIAAGLHGGSTLADEKNTLSFVTVTSKGAVTPEYSRAVFQRAWPKLIMRYRRADDSGGEYMLIPEQHESGVLHAHAVITGYQSSHWWHDNAHGVGMGYMAKSEKVYAVWGIAGYVAKYLTKQLADRTWPPKFRRIRVSDGWPKLPDLPGAPGWDYEAVKSKESAIWESHYLTDAGYTVQWSHEGFSPDIMALWNLPLS